MQYFTPEGDFFVGDPMPFFHEGTFRLYYLLDEKHHQAKGGLGGHQWAHASTTDLVHWEHHPLALPITHDWEGSICTGSAFYHDRAYYAFYATRMPDRKQHLCVATSRDGVRFTKSATNPLASPAPGYSPMHYRDPCVWRDGEGVFHMLATAMVEGCVVHDRGGCLAHLVSSDLASWELEDPFLVPGFLGPPECPDYFEWNGWYYLIFSNDGIARYRMSREPLGPWLRPKVDAFDCPMARVMKTAAYTGGRRIGVAYLASLRDDKDDGPWLYAGNAVFREIVQQDDGALRCKFPKEMVPASGESLALSFHALSDGVTRTHDGAHMRALQGFGVAALDGVPLNARFTLKATPTRDTAAFGVCVRGAGQYQSGYELRLSPHEQIAEIRKPGSRSIQSSGHRAIYGVEGLHEALTLDMVLRDDIIDVCIDGRRCLVNRCPELRGERLFLFCQNGDVQFESVEVRPLL